MNKRRTTEQFIKEAVEIHGNKYDYSEVKYECALKKVKIICKKHGIFEQIPYSHLSGRGCKKCTTEENSLLFRSTTEQFIKKAGKIHNNFFNYSNVKYINNLTKVEIICPIHGPFMQTPSAHFKAIGCPKCFRSKGEERIEKHLKENNIKFESQKTFKDCKDKGLLKFDFYLPDYNICIEFDGEQHFMPVRFNGISLKEAEKAFESLQKRDKIKKKYCNNHGIKLIRIKYTEINNTIREFENGQKDYNRKKEKKVEEE